MSKEISKKLYGIRDYIVRGSQPFNPAWYNEVMDDIDSIFFWLENIVEVEAGREETNPLLTEIGKRLREDNNNINIAETFEKNANKGE
tara:strand:- start:380 stop:643 length:264 start_codon:yes stop_codon:yes gene_type:complete